MNPTIEDIQSLVCRRFGISRVDLLSPRREAIPARQVAFFLAFIFRGHTLTRIGDEFNRDRSTIRTGAMAAADRIENDDELRREVVSIAAELVSLP